ESSYMAVRRGGRGRRRGGRRHSEGKPEARFETSGTEEAGFQENEIVEAEFVPTNGHSSDAKAEPVASDQPVDNRTDRPKRNDRGRRDGRNGRSDRRDRPPQPTISDLLREGQEILVQIAKEPIARKGARIT